MTRFRALRGLKRNRDGPKVTGGEAEYFQWGLNEAGGRALGREAVVHPLLSAGVHLSKKPTPIWHFQTWTIHCAVDMSEGRVEVSVSLVECRDAVTMQVGEALRLQCAVISLQPPRLHSSCLQAIIAPSLYF